uniref:Uncharacterized protein n=1 Tax=Setaria italica TaxID=4555 RepID=K3Y4E0_SETIT
MMFIGMLWSLFKLCSPVENPDSEYICWPRKSVPHLRLATKISDSCTSDETVANV